MIRIHRHGGPEVLQFEEVDLSAPSAGEVQVRNSAIGLNYADVYQREGSHGPHDERPMPLVLGGLAAGVVVDVGEDVRDFKPGDRVAYVHPESYAEQRNVPASRLLHLPDSISAEVAAAYLLRGLTAEYLLRRLYVLKEGDTALVHAAAGGMGVVLCQWANALGARVIGTVGSEDKAAFAKDHGCHDVIAYSREDFVERTEALTNYRGVDVVYDGLGKAAFFKSLECVRPMGMVISYGTASGDVGAFDLQALHKKSIIVARPTLRTWIAKRTDFETAAAALFSVISGGIVKTPIPHSYPLAEVAQAHRAIQSRGTTGAAILIP